MRRGRLGRARGVGGSRWRLGRLEEGQRQPRHARRAAAGVDARRQRREPALEARGGAADAALVREGRLAEGVLVGGAHLDLRGVVEVLPDVQEAPPAAPREALGAGADLAEHALDGVPRVALQLLVPGRVEPQLDADDVGSVAAVARPGAGRVVAAPGAVLGHGVAISPEVARQCL